MKRAIVWFKTDLRLHDNTLAKIVRVSDGSGKPTVPKLRDEDL